MSRDLSARRQIAGPRRVRDAMRKKKHSPLPLLFIVFAAAMMIFFVSSGFKKRTDVYLQDFSVSEDGSVITVWTALAGSMGFIRAIETEQTGSALHCSFYCAFGGFNSGIGAENCFAIHADASVETIYFDRGEEAGALVLERDAATGEWAQP